jgi:hypothetical protein
LWYTSGVFVALLALAGCDRLEAASSVVDQFGDTTVAQAVFLGADIPDGVELPEESGIYSSYCKVFLAEVADAGDVSDSPLGGASVSFMAPSTGKLPFAETDVGEYRLYSTDGLVYDPGENVRVQFTAGGEAGALEMDVPEAPEFTVPSSIHEGEAVVAEITAGEFPNLVAWVYDVANDHQTWDDIPDDVDAAAALDDATEPMTKVAIPGEAFRRASTYVVGVAGITTGNADDYEGVNRALSTFAAGRMALRLVTVEPAGK